MSTHDQTFIEVNRFFEGETDEKDDLTVVEQSESVDSIDAYPSPTDGNVAAINIDEEDYHSTIELSEDVIKRAYERLQDAGEPPES
jgi:hypothetical protein